ncbi:MAG: hypothetical protein M3Y13_08880 [Armatimonadota bacterium]|nr:hypothetical protein [Armatimonadota bacterium]
MKLTKLFTLLGLAATVAGAALAPLAAHADDASRQKNKNLWRNGAIAGGAAALYGLHSHNRTTTLLGVAGAAYAAHRYEQDRHSQSQASAARARYYRSHRNTGTSYRYYGSPSSRTRTVRHRHVRHYHHYAR